MRIRIKQIKGLTKDGKYFYYIFINDDRPIVKLGWDRVILKLKQLL